MGIMAAESAIKVMEANLDGGTGTGTDDNASDNSKASRNNKIDASWFD